MRPGLRTSRPKSSRPGPGRRRAGIVGGGSVPRGESDPQRTTWRQLVGSALLCPEATIKGKSFPAIANSSSWLVGKEEQEIAERVLPLDSEAQKPLTEANERSGMLISLAGWPWAASVDHGLGYG